MIKCSLQLILFSHLSDIPMDSQRAHIRCEFIKFLLSKYSGQDFKTLEIDPVEEFNKFLAEMPHHKSKVKVNPYDRSVVEAVAEVEFTKVGDEGLFPNYTDKDIWIDGFVSGFGWKAEVLPLKG
jgi:hypothetical protein